MKKFIGVVGLMLMLSVASFANVHAFSRTAKATYKVAKFVSYPVRHPKKSTHAAVKFTKFSAKQVF